jgi:NADH-quinone oxidoreductase subunit A
LRIIFLILVQLYFLQAASTGNSTLDYLPIGIQLLFAIILVGGILMITHLIGPKRKTAEKLENFESGIEGQGNARQPMAIKYFLVAILFVLFDVEVIFFYPYAVNFRDLGWHGFIAIVMFIGFFLTGFIYIIKKGALNWEE